jgi:hypothetical protein
MPNALVLAAWARSYQATKSHNKAQTCNTRRHQATTHLIRFRGPDDCRNQTVSKSGFGLLPLIGVTRSSKAV